MPHQQMDRHAATVMRWRKEAANTVSLTQWKRVIVTT